MSRFGSSEHMERDTKSRSKRLVIETGNMFPRTSDDVSDYSESWMEFHQYFLKNTVHFSSEGEDFSISADASDIISAYQVIEQDSLFEKRKRARDGQGKHPYCCDLVLNVKSKKAFEKSQTGYRIVYRFLQQLFVAMHVSAPGSFSFGHSGEVSDLKEKMGIDAVNLDNMFSDSIEFGYRKALDNNWPNLNRVPFKKSWEWLHRNQFYNLNIAKKPWEKACFTLLYLGQSHLLGEDSVFKIVRILELFFVDGRENLKKIFKERTHLVFGEPSKHKKIMGELYDLRSSIAHGTALMVRPGILSNNDRMDEPDYFFYNNNSDYAIALLLALLQDLVMHNAVEYNFLQRFERLYHSRED